MKKIILLAVLLMSNSCLTHSSSKNEETPLTQGKNKNEISKKIFFEVDSLLKTDNGKFWDKPLYGPIIFIDPETREFIANENNSSDKFRKINSVFSDTLPNDINIANTALNWENKRWTMVMLPLPIDKTSRNNLVIHELFHRIQPEIGFEDLEELNNGHLDTYEGRLLLIFELQALKKALSAENDSLRKLHLTNAFTFRNKRQTNEERKNAENSLEINEGLAEYTAIMLSGRNENDMKLHLTNGVNQFYDNPSFVRSFAYQTLPIYGYLLSLRKINWHKEISRSTNLTDFFIKSFAIETSTNISFELIAKENDYDYENIAKKEKARENGRLEKITKFKTTFLKQPTLKLYFENMNISFDPRNITPLENFGTVYPTMRVTDNWGILSVKNGALLGSNWESVIVSAPTEISDEIVKGDGWTLELKNGWKVNKVENKFELKKK